MKGAFTPNAVWHMPEALSFSLLIKDFPEDFLLLSLDKVLMRVMSHLLLLLKEALLQHLLVSQHKLFLVLLV